MRALAKINQPTDVSDIEENDRGPSRIASLLSTRPIIAIALYIAFGAAITLYVSWRHQSQLEHATAIRAATSYSNAVTSIRTFYAREIVPKAKEAGVIVSHDYRVKPGTIPFPATLSIDLGEELVTGGGGSHYRLYSDYPFPWRSDRKMDAFDREALSAIMANPKAKFSRIEQTDAGKVIRYATAVVMGKACVECHNSHELSPRTDWRIGDIRGAQQVIIPLANSAKFAYREIAMLALISALGLALIWFLMSQLQKSLRRTQKLATISERRNKELAIAKSEAERANAAKSRFMAHMSHELRTPLNSIIGFSDVIQNAEQMPHVQMNIPEYASDIHTSGTHLLDLINEILDMSKIEAVMYEITEETVNIREIIAICLRMMDANAEKKGVKIDNQVADDLPHFFADARGMRQIVLNLTSNAVKFTDTGGRVTVYAAADREGLTLMVKDNGVGIPADRLDDVFEPFTQADNSLSRQHEGTGLGLPITKALIELHDGTIEISSVVGEGTQVTVQFPATRLRYPESPARAGQADATVSA
jgi:signal transduction histidine kinase